MSNPNQTPTYETPQGEALVTAQQVGERALAAAFDTEPTTPVTEHHMNDSDALAGPHPKWLGFSANGEPKLSRQARFKARQESRQHVEELGGQTVDVTREEDRLFDVA